MIGTFVRRGTFGHRDTQRGKRHVRTQSQRRHEARRPRRDGCGDWSGPSTTPGILGTLPTTPETRRREDWFSPGGFRGSMTLPTP